MSSCCSGSPRDTTNGEASKGRRNSIRAEGGAVPINIRCEKCELLPTAKNHRAIRPGAEARTTSNFDRPRLSRKPSAVRAAVRTNEAPGSQAML